MDDVGSGMRISVRRVVFLAAVLAVVAVIAWKEWERDFMLRTAEPVAPAPLPLPVTDVSDWASRSALLSHHERMVELLGPDVEPMDARCGSPHRHYENPRQEPEEIRLTYADAWGRDAFTVDIVPRADGAVATWRRFSGFPPPPPPEPGRGASTEPAPDADRFSSETTRQLGGAAWKRMLASVRDPAFSQLVPSNPHGLDGFTATIETCTDGRYHLVERWSPHGVEHAAFWATLQTIVEEAGQVHSVAGYALPDEPKVQGR